MGGMRYAQMSTKQLARQGPRTSATVVGCEPVHDMQLESSTSRLRRGSLHGRAAARVGRRPHIRVPPGLLLLLLGPTLLHVLRGRAAVALVRDRRRDACAGGRDATGTAVGCGSGRVASVLGSRRAAAGRTAHRSRRRRRRRWASTRLLPFCGLQNLVTNVSNTNFTRLTPKDSGTHTPRPTRRSLRFPHLASARPASHPRTCQ